MRIYKKVFSSFFHILWWKSVYLVENWAVCLEDHKFFRLICERSLTKKKSLKFHSMQNIQKNLQFLITLSQEKYASIKPQQQNSFPFHSNFHLLYLSFLLFYCHWHFMDPTIKESFIPQHASWWESFLIFSLLLFSFLIVEKKQFLL